MALAKRRLWGGVAASKTELAMDAMSETTHLSRNLFLLVRRKGRKVIILGSHKKRDGGLRACSCRELTRAVLARSGER